MKRGRRTPIAHLKKRLLYLAAFLLLTAVEVLIALFVRDAFIRPYGGDILVVIVLYCFVRLFVPEGARWLPAAIFLLAVAVEGLQAVHFVDLIGLGGIPFFRILLGTSFSWWDIACYAAGCALLYVYEWLAYRKKSVDRKPPL